MFYLKHLILCLNALLISSCAATTLSSVLSPAEINTRDIRKVAVGNFEIGLLAIKFKTERNGVWETHPVNLNKEQRQTISRSIRSRIINLLTSTPYLKVVFTDEFEKLEKDSSLQQLVSAGGYKTRDVDAVINGKLWLEIERTDGVDLSKENLEYFRPPRSNRSLGLNLTVDQVVWWPYKSARGSMALEIKMTRLKPTEVLASTFETRTFSQRTGGRNNKSFQKMFQGITTPFTPSNPKEKDSIETSDEVLPSFEQIIADLAMSIANNFVRRVSITEKMVSLPIANSDHPNIKILIEAGAYDLAIEQLQKTTAEDPNPNDLYNLGLCFEAIGDYGLAHSTYREAWKADSENLLFTNGLGRIESLRRENPQLRRQLESR